LFLSCRLQFKNPETNFLSLTVHMKRAFFLRGITLLLFVSLFTGFLLHRSGKFDNYFPPKDPRSQPALITLAANSSQKHDDTVPVPKDSAGKLRMFSSKSMVLTEKKTTNEDSAKKRTEFMSSSKSARTFSEKDFRLLFDTTKRKSTKTKTQKKQ
jgi:hypothetical protein